MLSNRIIIGFLFVMSVFSSAFGQRDSFTFVRETSRPESQIQKIFPYDISLMNAEGEILNSSTAFVKAGKATVLLFWMTSCGPCRMELNAISRKFKSWKEKSDFAFYAISTDFSNKTEQFKKRVMESNWPFPAYLDVNREFRYVMEGNLNGLPQVFVLNRDAQVVYHAKRYQPGDEDRLFEVLRKL